MAIPNTYQLTKENTDYGLALKVSERLGIPREDYEWGSFFRPSNMEDDVLFIGCLETGDMDLLDMVGR